MNAAEMAKAIPVLYRQLFSAEQQLRLAQEECKLLREELRLHKDEVKKMVIAHEKMMCLVKGAIGARVERLETMLTSHVKPTSTSACGPKDFVTVEEMSVFVEERDRENEARSKLSQQQAKPAAVDIPAVAGSASVQGAYSVSREAVEDMQQAWARLAASVAATEERLVVLSREAREQAETQAKAEARLVVQTERQSIELRDWTARYLRSLDVDKVAETLRNQDAAVKRSLQSQALQFTQTLSVNQREAAVRNATAEAWMEAQRCRFEEFEARLLAIVAKQEAQNCGYMDKCLEAVQQAVRRCNKNHKKAACCDAMESADNFPISKFVGDLLDRTHLSRVKNKSTQRESPDPLRLRALNHSHDLDPEYARVIHELEGDLDVGPCLEPYATEPTWPPEELPVESPRAAASPELSADTKVLAGPGLLRSRPASAGVILPAASSWKGTEPSCKPAVSDERKIHTLMDVSRFKRSRPKQSTLK